MHPSSVPLPSATTWGSFSPFCVVDVGGDRTKALMLDHMKQTHGGKVTEWTPTSFQADISWKKDWQQQTMFIPDEEGLPSPPLAMSGREGSLDHSLTCLGLGQVRLLQRSRSSAMEQTLLSFRIEARGIKSTEFVKFYNEYLHKLLTRWS